MSDFPDLHAFVLLLHPQGSGPPVRPQGHGAQALFLDLLRQVAPELAIALHADAPSKPYTVAILPDSQQNQIALRISLLRSDLFQPFLHTMLRQMPSSELRLGQARLRLGDVIGTPIPQGHPWAGYSSFTTIAAAAKPARIVTLEFATPTAIGQGERADGKPRLAILPMPELIFVSLAKRWNELAPPDLHVDLTMVRTATQDTLIPRYRAQSSEIDLGKGPQKGFIGLCTYELPPDSTHARILTLLADAALFLGVGMKTARGMGLCRRVA